MAVFAALRMLLTQLFSNEKATFLQVELAFSKSQPTAGFREPRFNGAALPMLLMQGRGGDGGRGSVSPIRGPAEPSG